MKPRDLKLTPRITDASEHLKKFIDDLKKYPLLTPDQEYELGLRNLEGDKAAYDKLVLHNLRFVISVAKKYMGRNLEIMDLIAEGIKGLMKATKTFDPTKGFKLISWAVLPIRVSIWSYILKHNGTVTIPSHVKRFYDKSKRKAALMSQEQGIEINPYDVMVQDYPEHAPTVIDCITSMSQEIGEEFTIEDTLFDRDDILQDELVIQNSLPEAITDALKDLTQIERDVIVYSFGLYGTQLTRDEIGELYCKTGLYIGVIKARVLRKLKSNETLKELYYE